MQIATELTSALVEDLLLHLNDESDRSPVTLLELAEIHECRPMLASAWEAEGTELSPGLAHEVDLYRRRASGQRELFADLEVAVGGLEVIKGFRIAELYPAGWVRGGKDLDLRAGNQDAVWAVAKYLGDRGWACRGALLQRIGGHDCMVIALSSDSLDPMVLRPEMVEIGTTVFAPGNFFALAPLAAAQLSRPIPPLVSHFLGVLEQRLERKVVVRDIVDAVALLQAMSEGDLDELRAVVDRLLLWKELGELAFVLEELDLIPGGALIPARCAQDVRRARRRRVLRGGARGLNPLVLSRLAAHKTAIGEWDGDIVQMLGARLPRLIPASRVHAAGLPLAGALIAPEVTSEAITTEVVAGQLIATCPLGVFMMLYGREFEPDAVDAVRAHFGLPPAPADDL